ncbi:uncharacterized protein LOC109801401 [Cajanus cajan]|uniref:Uncharacterized protein n=1 Tax=Cajanus cajan TaxID=3821 RepID=A0A151TI75_CAJCA|nr:uncharacterized protein LOC109801401 [Cajanus cajan]KYP66757.1 hypothetical protein KK1_013065 [Cajanus cajan]
MIHSIKAVLTYPPLSFPRSLSSNLGRETSVIRFCSQPDNTAPNMDKNEKPSEGDLMSHSFGEGYATRSDEEGFGGIYGGNQSIHKTQTENSVHENHPAYDKTQGSEVKEKEKARHQKSANTN